MKKWFFVEIFFETTILNFSYVVYASEEGIEGKMQLPQNANIQGLAIYELTPEGEEKERKDLSEKILISLRGEKK